MLRTPRDRLRSGEPVGALALLIALMLGGCTLVNDSEAYRQPQVDAAPEPACGNEVCEPGETHDSCKDDCDKPDDDDDDD